jgi:hypothetical protein
MEGVFHSKHQVSPYLEKTLALMADTNIQELTYCIKKCSTLQNLNDSSISLQDKICLGNFFIITEDRCAYKISFDV